MSQIARDIRDLTAKAKLSGNFDQEPLHALYEAVSANFNLNEIAISERIGHGDLSALDSAMPIIGRDAEKSRREWSEKLLTPEFASKNLDLCVPLVRSILSGDVQARTQYEANRLLLWGSLPQWLKSGIEKNITATIAPLIIKFKDLPLTVQSAVPWGTDSRLTLRSHLVIEPLRLVGFTHLSAAGVLEAAAACREYGSNNSNLATQTLIQNITPQAELNGPRAFYFDPTPVGDYLAAAMSRALTLCLNGRFLEDIRTVLELPVDDTLLLTILNLVETPWGVLGTSRLKKMLAVKSICDATPELRDRFGELMIAKDPGRTALRLTTSGVPLAGVFRAIGSQEFADNEKEATLSEQFTGLCSVLASRRYDLDNSEMMREAQRLFSLLKKGVCTYPQVIEALANGDPLAAVNAKLRGALLGGESELDQLPAALEGIEPSNTKSHRPEVMQHEVLISPKARREILSRGYNAKRRIDQRVSRFLERGHVGDAEKLKDQEDLYAMRIDLGKGIRIYYTKPNLSTMKIYWIGDKSSQVDDIAKAATLLAEEEEAENYFTTNR